MLPEKWCVKVTPESKEILEKWRTCGVMTSESGYCCYQGYLGHLGTRGFFTPNKGDLVEISLEQFKVDVLKEIKEIIGYKSPMDLFNGTVVAGSLFVPVTGIGGVKEGMWYRHATTTSGYSRYLPKEIVETWEPVYKKEFINLLLGNPIREFIVSSKKVSMHGYTFSKEEVTDAMNLFTTHLIGKISSHISKVQFGCGDGVELTREDVFKIRKTMESL